MTKMLKRAGVLMSASLVSAQAFAVDHSAAITAAETDAIANVTAAATAVIAVAAVVFGVYLVIKIINK